MSYKKLLVQVNYFPSRYDQVRHAEKYPAPPAVCSGKRERVSNQICFFFSLSQFPMNWLIYETYYLKKF